MDLLQKLNELLNLLDIELNNYQQYGIEYAKAFTEYRKMLAKELLRLKVEGMPVTIAYDIARGEEKIAQAKFNELRSEAIYKACQESINVYKLQLKVIQNQIDKDWGKNE